MLREGDCAVIISNSGRSRDLLDVADIARRKGATVIAITASGSPLAVEAMQGARAGRSILLAADHPEDADRYSPMVSRLLHLVIVDILATGVALRLGSMRLKPMLAEIKRNLRQRRYAAPPPPPDEPAEEAIGATAARVATIAGVAPPAASPSKPATP
jgi:RpiR family carbohydrate utilization transcriptional regulator